MTVSPDVTVVSDRYGGFITPLAPSLTPPRVTRPLSSEVAGVDGGMLKRERLGCADCVREGRRASGFGEVEVLRAEALQVSRDLITLQTISYVAYRVAILVSTGCKLKTCTKR